MADSRAPTRDRSPLLVLMSGLPGSGKTTLGRQLAQVLGIGFVDKDAYLETLFEQTLPGSLYQRNALSRRSDALFVRDALTHSSAVLVSHWRPPGADTESGTPVCVFQEAGKPLVEVCCQCSVDTAAERFARRVRHPGHCDHLRNPEDVLRWMKAYQSRLPLGLGKVLYADTQSRPSSGTLARQIQATVTRG